MTSVGVFADLTDQTMPLPAAPALADVVGVADELGVERLPYHVFDWDDAQMLRRLDRTRASLPA